MQDQRPPTSDEPTEPTGQHDGLTPRERQLVDDVCDGPWPTRLARDLDLSPHRPAEADPPQHTRPGH